MENYGGLCFRKFEENDINIFTKIIKEAYIQDSQIHTGVIGCPLGYDNGDIFRERYFQKDAASYAVFKDSNPLGGFSLLINEETQKNYLENLFIDPNCHSKGLGLIIWKFIEQKYPKTKVWETKTIWFSTRNHYFYVNKCGFKIVRISKPEKDGTPCMYFMEKEMLKEQAKVPVTKIR